jgi:hypothetical protein
MSWESRANEIRTDACIGSRSVAALAIDLWWAVERHGRFAQLAHPLNMEGHDEDSHFRLVRRERREDVRSGSLLFPISNWSGFTQEQLISSELLVYSIQSLLRSCPVNNIPRLTLCWFIYIKKWSSDSHKQRCKKEQWIAGSLWRPGSGCTQWTSSTFYWPRQVMEPVQIQHVYRNGYHLSLFFFFDILGFELRTFSLPGRNSTTWAMLPALVCIFVCSLK